MVAPARGALAGCWRAWSTQLLPKPQTLGKSVRALLLPSLLPSPAVHHVSSIPTTLSFPTPHLLLPSCSFLGERPPHCGYTHSEGPSLTLPGPTTLSSFPHAGTTSAGWVGRAPHPHILTYRQVCGVYLHEVWA